MTTQVVSQHIRTPAELQGLESYPSYTSGVQVRGLITRASYIAVSKTSVLCARQNVQHSQLSRHPFCTNKHCDNAKAFSPQYRSNVQPLLIHSRLPMREINTGLTPPHACLPCLQISPCSVQHPVPDAPASAAGSNQHSHHLRGREGNAVADVPVALEQTLPARSLVLLRQPSAVLPSTIRHLPLSVVPQHVQG